MPWAQGCAGTANIEYSFQALGPGHGGTALGGCLLICLFRFPRPGLTTLTTFTSASRGNPCSVFAVGGDKIAGRDFEQPQAGPKGEGQDARSNTP